MGATAIGLIIGAVLGVWTGSMATALVAAALGAVVGAAVHAAMRDSNHWIFSLIPVGTTAIRVLRGGLRTRSEPQA